MKQYVHLILVGMKHTGKSTVGALLAERLARPFFDTDALITQIAGASPRELYDAGGAALMMEREAEACRSLSGLSPAVIATGGGLADNEAALQAITPKNLVIYLDTPFEILYERIMAIPGAT